MATIDEARRLITDPEYTVKIGQSAASPVIEMQAERIAETLVREHGAEDEIAARILVGDAARDFGGITDFVTRAFGTRGRTIEEFRLFMPRSALRE
jgi:hypothetical protein